MTLRSEYQSAAKRIPMTRAIFAAETYMTLSADELQQRFEERAKLPSSKAAREHLAAGRWVAYRNPETPVDQVLRMYPDGTITTTGPDGAEKPVSGPDLSRLPL